MDEAVGVGSLTKLVGAGRIHRYFASVAQLVEQMTLNHWVYGSNPYRGRALISRLPVILWKPFFIVLTKY